MYNDVVSSFCSTAEVNAVSMETISYPVHQEDNTQSADIVLDFKTLIGLRYYDVMLVHVGRSYDVARNWLITSDS